VIPFQSFSFISLIPKSSCRPWAWGNIPDGLIPDGITSYLVQSLYIWKQKWAPPSFKSLIRHSSDIRIPDQCKPHSSFISSSVHTLIRCLKLSIMLLSTVWSQAQLSIDNIINLDLIHQYRPKSAIGKTPLEKRNRPSTLLQQITISNYNLLFHIFPWINKFTLYMIYVSTKCNCFCIFISK
jgi:hypothetical protein